MSNKLVAFFVVSTREKKTSPYVYYVCVRRPQIIPLRTLTVVCTWHVEPNLWTSTQYNVECDHNTKPLN